jgi:hypothetical protein
VAAREKHAPQSIVIERDLFTVETQIISEVSASL